MTIKVGIVAMVPLSSITVGERARKMMGDLDGLETNMKESGLIAPLAVKDNKDGTYLLLAGERRYTVLKRNNIETIPVRIYPEGVSEAEIKIIEKSENFWRKDFEYYELDQLTMEIHQMQQELYGVKSPGPGQSGHSLEDTGELIGGLSKGAVSMSIKRAEARDAFPELFDGCKTASDASKVLRRLDEEIIKQTILQRLDTQQSSGTLAQLSKCFINKSFFEGVKQIPDEIMHLVEIDPPYALDLAKNKKKDGTFIYDMSEYNEIDKSIYMNGSDDSPWKGMNTLFKECYRVMAPHSWLICWFAPEPWFNDIYTALISAGFNTTRMCGIWTKSTGQTNQFETMLANTYEMFFYAWKGKPALNKIGKGNDFRYPPIPAQQKTHPTERPKDLVKNIYETFAFPGSRVLIPFLGSGSGLIAAHELGLSPIGFELSKSYKDSFLVRVHKMSQTNIV
jgi:DNA modification methylase